MQVMQERSGLTCAVCNGAVYDFAHVYRKLAETNSNPYRPIIDGWVKKCGRRHVKALKREGASIPERLSAAFSRLLLHTESPALHRPGSSPCGARFSTATSFYHRFVHALPQSSSVFDDESSGYKA